jgi:hypothetical protein
MNSSPAWALGIELRVFMLARQALLPLKPLHQPFFVLGIFEIGSLELVALGWFRTVMFLITASGVARITGMSHWLLI